MIYYCPLFLYLIATSKTDPVSPDGTWMVFGPTLSIILLINLILAKVPLAMISSFPLLDP